MKCISGSDCHTLEQVGVGGIETEQPIGDIRELAKLIKNTQVKLFLQKD